MRHEVDKDRIFNDSRAKRAQANQAWVRRYPRFESASRNTNAALFMVEQKLIELETRVAKLEKPAKAKPEKKKPAK